MEKGVACPPQWLQMVSGFAPVQSSGNIAQDGDADDGQQLRDLGRQAAKQQTPASESASSFVMPQDVAYGGANGGQPHRDLADHAVRKSALAKVVPHHQQRRQLSPCTYTLMSDALSWADADAACQAAGLQLASVQSAAQNALLVTAAAGNEVWIGGTDAASEGTWVWSPSNTPLSYTNWYPGEPNNLVYDNGNEDCLNFNWHAPGKWNDGGCTAKLKYVCQQPH